MFCPTCGTQNQDRVAHCRSCGSAMPVAPTSGAGDANDLALILPVNTNGWAIAAGYLGLFSVLGIFGPLALLCGAITLVQLKRRPGSRGHVRAWLGVVMGSLGSILLILFVIAATRP